jgi:hypothetical protein
MNALQRLFKRFSALNRTPNLDEEQLDRLKRSYPLLRSLSQEDTAALRERANQVLRRIHIDFHPDLAPDPDLRAAVAALAALPVLNRGVDWYGGVRSIYLVPGYYETETTYVDEAGVVHEGLEEASGEMVEQGPVVLSAPDVSASGQGRGYNVVIHEMAHIIDLSNGELDGEPALPGDFDRAAVEACRNAFEGAYAEHCRRVRRPGGGGARPAGRRIPRAVIDSYGAENPAEFFACATELFFESPRRLERGHPELHRQLSRLYGFAPRATDAAANR